LVSVDNKVFTKLKVISLKPVTKTISFCYGPKKNIKEEILKLPEIYPHPIFKVTTDPNIKTWSFKTINLYENTEETLWKEFQHVFNQKQNLSKKKNCS